jgi:hypothetical protein
MNNELTVDAALRGVYDRIGFYLTQAGLEDASGARRFYMELLRSGHFKRVATDFKVDTETIIKEFRHLYPFAEWVQQICNGKVW